MPNCSTCGCIVEYVRNCFRSQWRLHKDPAILTPGRYYFAPPGTPAAPIGTLLGSRDWTSADRRGDEPRGEWAGKRKYDNGAAPIFLPLPRIVGSPSCISDGASDPEAAAIGPDSFRTVCIGGRDYQFPTIIWVSFSVAYADTDFTYYNDVPLTLTDAMCEARYEGVTDIENVKAIVRVTDVPDGSLATNFYLCDSTPVIPPVTTNCCPSNPIAGNLFAKVRIGIYDGAALLWDVQLVNIPMAYDSLTGKWLSDEDAPEAQMSVGKVRLNMYCFTDVFDQTYMPSALDVFASNPIGDPLAWHTFSPTFFLSSAVVLSCSPFLFFKGLHVVTGYFGDVDGHQLSGVEVWKAEWEIADTPF